MFIAIHPATCRGGGFLAHGVLKFPQLKTRFGLFESHAKKAVQITKKAYIPKNRTDTLDKKCIDYYNS